MGLVSLNAEPLNPTGRLNASPRRSPRRAWLAACHFARPGLLLSAQPADECPHPTPRIRHRIFQGARAPGHPSAAAHTAARRVDHAGRRAGCVAAHTSHGWSRAGFQICPRSHLRQTNPRRVRHRGSDRGADPVRQFKRHFQSRHVAARARPDRRFQKTFRHQRLERDQPRHRAGTATACRNGVSLRAARSAAGNKG